MFRYEHPHPAVTVDIVVLAIGQARPSVLLVRRGWEPFAGRWALPGGFVGIDESLDAAARRELEEETGLAGLTLEQLHAFGEPQRDPRERVISITYLAVLSDARPAIRPGSDAADADWFDVEDLPDLAFDHDDMVALAREQLRAAE